MTELSDEQYERVRDIVETLPTRIEKRLDRLEQGEVVNHKRASSYRGVAMKHEKIAFFQLYSGDIESAQDQFSQAAFLYQKAATAASEQPPYATSRRRIPMTLLEALYIATLAGEGEMLRGLAEEICQLRPAPEDAGENDVEYNADKYYLARCFAGVVLDCVDDEDISRLEDVNQEKSSPHSLYGQAVIEFATGVRDEGTAQIIRAIESMVTFHERDRLDDNVFNKIMATPATAMLIIAHQKGYDINVDSEFIPMELIEAST